MIRRAMNKELQSLEQLIDDAVAKETALQKQEAELALQNEQFAMVLEQHKRQAAELDVLWGLVREYMEANDIWDHRTASLELKLVPMGKYKAENIEEVDDEFCDIKRVINNKKVKAYYELNHKLPNGVESYGNRLVKKLL